MFIIFIVIMEQNNNQSSKKRQPNTNKGNKIKVTSSKITNDQNVERSGAGANRIESPEGVDGSI